jgi:hypothetical protein
VGEQIKNEDDRQFIIDTIENLYDRQKIVDTKLLYRFPLMKIINPHVKIDNEPKYIIIATFVNRNEKNEPYMIAMYSEKELSIQDQTINNTSKGFVASVTNRKAYYRVLTDKSSRLTEYNQYFMIFGKGEIQIKVNSDEMEFNIGHQYKSINTGSHKTPEIFTGGIEDKCKMIGYEVYQIALENK